MRSKAILAILIIIVSFGSIFAISGNTIIAHRGASSYEIENSLESFEKAIELEADMIEFDVQKTLDNELIVYHDLKLNGVQVKDAEYNYIEENTNYHVPLLQEVLEKLSGRTKIDIDIKKKGYEIEVVESSLNYFNKSDIIISSRSEESLKMIKKDYNITTMIILGNTNKEKIGLFFGFLPEKRIEESGADYIAMNNLFVGKRILAKAEKMGKQVFVWNVGKYKGVRGPKVQGLIVKNPIK